MIQCDKFEKVTTNVTLIYIGSYHQIAWKINFSLNLIYNTKIFKIWHLIILFNVFFNAKNDDENTFELSFLFGTYNQNYIKITNFSKMYYLVKIYNFNHLNFLF